ncbi:MAG: dTDP-4-dehydrorhamnose reductase [Bacteroidales bacterium]|nr:dTDP-4-dehydrorhamnose reductase [Bacteroidales bacterium]
MDILVFGGKGQLGQAIKQIADNYVYTFNFSDADTVDLCHPDLLEEYLSRTKFDIIFNCAAYTNVDGAEEHQEICKQLNISAPEIMAKYCKQKNKVLFHISSDYVFDGSGSTPLKEGDPTSPCNFYGMTKLEGEKAILNYNPAGFILRVSGLVSPYGKNFFLTMKDLLETKEEVSVVSTQTTKLTSAVELAKVMIRLIGKESAGTTILHFANRHPMTWYDFAVMINEHIHSKCAIRSVAEYPQKAVRPQYSVLDTSKIEDEYNISIKRIDDVINKIISQQ